MSITTIPRLEAVRSDSLGVLLAAGIPGNIVHAGEVGESGIFIIDEGDMKHRAEVSQHEVRFSPVLAEEDPDETAYWLANLSALSVLAPAAVLSSFRTHRKASILARVLAGSPLKALHGVIESVNSARQLIVLSVGGTAYTLYLGRDYPRLSTAGGAADYVHARKVLARVSAAAGLSIEELISAMHDVFRTAERSY